MAILFSKTKIEPVWIRDYPEDQDLGFKILPFTQQEIKRVTREYEVVKWVKTPKGKEEKETTLDMERLAPYLYDRISDWEGVIDDDGSGNPIKTPCTAENKAQFFNALPNVARYVTNAFFTAAEDYARQKAKVLKNLKPSADGSD